MLTMRRDVDLSLAYQPSIGESKGFFERRRTLPGRSMATSTAFAQRA